MLGINCGMLGILADLFFLRKFPSDKSKWNPTHTEYQFWSNLEAKHKSVPFSCSRIGYRRTMTSLSANDEASKVAVPPERRRVFGAGVLFPTPGSHTHTHTHTHTNKENGGNAMNGVGKGGGSQ